MAGPKPKLSNQLKSIRKDYGPRSAGSGDQLALTDRRALTGIIDLDRVLGGGFPLGRIVMFFGDKSGGKTTTAKIVVGVLQNICRNCYRTAKNVVAIPPSPEELKEDPEARWSASGECDCYAAGLYVPEPLPKEPGEKPKEYNERVAAHKQALLVNSYEEFVCGWMDSEHSFHRKWATHLGVDMRRLVILFPDSAEEAIDIYCAVLSTGQIDFISIDSIAQLVPAKEIEETMEKWQQGLQARIVNKACRKIVNGIGRVAKDGRSVSQIWINQTREKIGVMFGDPTTKPGGKGQEFAVHSEVRFRKSKVESMTEIYGTKEDSVDIPISETFNFASSKNKTEATSTADGTYKICLRANDTQRKGQVIDDEKLYKLVTHYLVKEIKGVGYKIWNQTFTTQKSLKEAVSNDPVFADSAKKNVIRILCALPDSDPVYMIDPKYVDAPENPASSNQASTPEPEGKKKKMISIQRPAEAPVENPIVESEPIDGLAGAIRGD